MNIFPILELQAFCFEVAGSSSLDDLVNIPIECIFDAPLSLAYCSIHKPN